jgi:gluconolactonase
MNGKKRFILLSLSLLVISVDNFAENVTKQCPESYIRLNNHNKLALISEHFLFLEGPTWSEQYQRFYFSEMDFNGPQEHGPQSTIYQLTLPNKVSVYKKEAGTNGLLAVGEYLYTMNHATRSLSKVNVSSGHNELIVDHYQGLKFNSPNDLTQANTGTIYFTDPDWQLSGRQQEIPYTGVYAYTTKGEVRLVDKFLVKPNGIALSPDQQTLYVGNFNNEIVKYTIDNDGNIGSKEVFVNIHSPDGMAVDCIGNIYASSHNEGNIYVYSRTGTQIDKISVGPKVTNMAFGGNDMKTLLITTDHGLYRLNVNVPGMQPTNYVL